MVVGLGAVHAPLAPGSRGPGRTLSTTLGSGLSAVFSMVIVHPSWYPNQTNHSTHGSSRRERLSTGVGLAAAHAPPGSHGPGQTLPAMVDPPNSSYGSSL